MDKEIPLVLYMWVQKRAYDKSVDGTLNTKDFPNFFRAYHLPKKLWQPILKEMEKLNLIERKNKLKVKIINIEKNLLDDMHKLQECLGFF